MKINIFFKKINLLFLVLLLNINSQLYAEPLSYSQGPGPMYSIGLNVQKKNDFLVTESFHVHGKRLIVLNDFYYGITNELTAGMTIPILFRTPDRKRGFGNIDTCLEYMFYHDEGPFYKHYATVTGIVKYPTSSLPRGFKDEEGETGSFAVALSRGSEIPGWFHYADIGYEFFLRKHDSQLGNRFRAGMGLGKTIIQNDTIFLGLKLEMNFYHSNRDIENKEPVLDSGLTSLFLGPVLRFSWHSMVLQAGLQGNIASRTSPRGLGTKFRYAFSFSYVF